MALLKDADPNVRSSAAYALMNMSDPAAAPGLQAALGVDYGVTAAKTSRNPMIRGEILRTALRKHPDADATEVLVKEAAGSTDPTLRYMALVAR